MQPVSEQWLSKHASTETDIHATIEVLLDYNSGNSVFDVVCTEELS